MLQAHLINRRLELEAQPETTSIASVRAWRDTLCRAAARLWGGVEGKPWRIVQDQTVIGFHANNPDTGEAIELR